MPYQRYRRDLERPGFVHDPAQENAIRHLQAIYDQLVQHPEPIPSRSLTARLSKAWSRPPKVSAVKGLYVWGGVGRGKTYLVDTFFDALPLTRKRRLHFHQLMQQVQRELKNLGHRRDTVDLVANQWALQARELCLDEFYVADIADAMILAGLLRGLFAAGVTLVTTSNIPPDELYKDGLQRGRFLPAIDLLKAHTTVLNVDGGVDYRLRYLERAEVYLYPLGAEAEARLNEAFIHLAPEPGERGGQIEIERRWIPTVRRADGVVWFRFRALCQGPRSANDYLEIARCYPTVLLSEVPILAPTLENAARRFLNLIDAFYDHNVRLIISAAVPPEELYRGSKLQFEYRRVVSRLQEMQSLEYLARPHRS